MHSSLAIPRFQRRDAPQGKWLAIARINHDLKNLLAAGGDRGEPQRGPELHRRFSCLRHRLNHGAKRSGNASIGKGGSAASSRGITVISSALWTWDRIAVR